MVNFPKAIARILQTTMTMATLGLQDTLVVLSIAINKIE
jgi:hypothetical protein